MPEEAKNRSILSHFRYERFVAGVVGGAVSTLALQPLDLVKVRFQVHDGHTSARLSYSGLAHAFASILRDGGLAGLWQGASPNVAAVSSAWGLYFLGFNTIKSFLQENDQTPLSVGFSLLAGCVTGVGTLSLTNPLFVVKTRMCLQASRKNTFMSSEKFCSGILDGLKKIYRNEGVRGLYHGYVPGLVGTTHGALQFMAYEQMKSRYNIGRLRDINFKLTNSEYILFAAGSKMFAVMVTYPYQVVRSRLQDVYFRHRGIWDIVVRIAKYEGLSGFYKGLKPNLLRVTPACSITFVVYENVSRFLFELNA
ncbi:solute carrier family 25 member 32-like [Corticium candelabrum]|uniref:solute carrier family 25 member 32-like n=1 Tax=Corticium candelabrum TaxID=121492 RepID=UPI002E26F52C|nr:solute carrier family 25 member 32-like [Corticium candelabrum]